MTRTNTARRRGAYWTGRWAESLSAGLLRLKGYRIVTRGFRLPVGEIDIVARKADMLVCVEVKARRSLREAAEALTPDQRRRIGRAAEAFIAGRDEFAALGVRFDVMAVTPRRLPRHIKDAFRPD